MTEQGLITLFDMFEAFSGTRLNEKQKSTWDFMMAEDDDAQVLTKCRAFYRSGEAGRRAQKIPTPGDLIEQPLERADAAHLAWATCRKAIGEHGAYASIAFEDGAIAETVDAMGGWVAMCGATSMELDHLAWTFVKTYPSFAASPLAKMGKVLIGIHDRRNQANGHEQHVLKPVTVRTLGSAPQMPQLPEGDLP